MSANTILAIDTSGPRLQLALAQDKVTNIFVETLAKGHAEILFDRLALFLSENGTGYSDLTRIAVTTGPGSFTGLRIGISAARGLGLALDIGVIGVPNLFGLSLNAPDRPFAIILDARRDEAYAQKFAGPGQPITEPVLITANESENFCDVSVHPILRDPVIDIGCLAEFAAAVDPELFPPTPTYVRAADAKPQTKMRIARA